jgi:fructokinase
VTALRDQSDLPRLGGIEAGGTKFVCAVGTASGELLVEDEIATTTPDETVKKVLAFFAPHAPRLAALGIGCFGPIQRDPRLPSYGVITSTPKSSWSHYDIVGNLRRLLPIPIAFDTDVNAAAVAEGLWGTAQGLRTFVYLTVGTGIGGGVMAEGRVLHGLMHPEIGHMLVPHDRDRDPFDGVCPYHGDCLEGLASGPAMESRWGVSPRTLAPDHPAWALEAEYLAAVCANLVCCLSPQRIVLGGGLMRAYLLPVIRERLVTLLNGYVVVPQLMVNLEAFVVPTSLGGRAGVLGALALAAQEAGLLETVRAP